MEPIKSWLVAEKINVLADGMPVFLQFVDCSIKILTQIAFGGVKDFPKLFGIHISPFPTGEHIGEHFVFIDRGSLPPGDVSELDQADRNLPSSQLDLLIRAITRLLHGSDLLLAR